MTADEMLAHLATLGDEGRARDMAAYHKAPRVYLGIANPVTSDIAREQRQTLTLDDRLALADGLWKSDIFEARVLAAKLLEQARIRPDDSGAWELIVSWMPDLDSWAIADHVAISGQKRLVADPSRLDTVEGWTTSESLWCRRAALVFTLPWTKQNHPKPEDIAIRERVLGWAARYATDHAWFIQKAIGWWLRDLSKHDADRVRAFIAEHGDAMKPFARKEALRAIKD